MDSLVEAEHRHQAFDELSGVRNRASRQMDRIDDLRRTVVSTRSTTNAVAPSERVDPPTARPTLVAARFASSSCWCAATHELYVIIQVANAIGYLPMLAALIACRSSACTS